MEEGYSADIITLIDDEGIEREFEIIDSIDKQLNENYVRRFYALMPTFDLEDENLSKDETYFIFEVIEENGEEQLVEVEDEDLLDELAEEFENRLGCI